LLFKKGLYIYSRERLVARLWTFSPGAPHGGVGNRDDVGERITMIKGENYVLYHNEGTP
jgi:hypothetical protein